MIGVSASATTISIAKLVAGGQMPRPRYQNPTIERSGSGDRAHWYIRPYIDVLRGNTIERVKRRIVLGRCEAMGKREAIAKKNEIMATINRSDYIIQAQVKFGDFLEIYERGHVYREGTLAASTRAKYRAHLKKHIKPAFQSLMMCEVTTKRIEDWLESKAKAKMSSATRMDLRNIMSSIFTRAIDWGHWQDRNPVERVNMGGSKPVRQQKKLTPEQTRLFLAALPPDVRLMCCVGLFCALRVSEILGLQEKHLNFKANSIQIRQRYWRGDLDVPKNSRAYRDVPMGYLGAELKRVCQGDPERFVFQIKTKPKWGREDGLSRDDRDLLQHFLRPAAVKLGFHWPGFGFHSLRREAVTEISSTAGIGQAMEFAGHSTADMSLLYTLSDKSKQERAVKKYHEKILGKPVGGVQ